METKTAYPLTWPEGWPKTPKYTRHKSKFKVSSFAVARDNLIDELKRFRATDIILSTNIPLRMDGYPYASFRAPDDVGVAVYFKRKGKAAVLACDHFQKIEENMHSIFKTVDALRSIER